MSTNAGQAVAVESLSLRGNRYALLTGSGRGAVGVVWLQGGQSLDLLARYFRPASSPQLKERIVGSITYGVWLHATGSEAEAEDVVVLRLGAAEFEVHVHGGSQSRQSLQQALQAAGFVEQTPCDFLKRRSQSELAALIDTKLLRCETERAARWLLNQQAAWRTWLERIERLLVAPDLPSLGAACEQLLRRTELARHLTEPWKVVLAGEPNVGKSSLINALSGFTRAIVHGSPGTTRDVVTQRLVLDGWVIELADTAGQRVADSAIEARGVARARENWRLADCRVAVRDATRFSAESEVAWQPSPNLQVANKADLPGARWSADCLPVSALTRAGIEPLQAAILGVLLPEGADETAPLPLGAVLPELLVTVLQAAQTRELARLRSGVLQLREYCGLSPVAIG